MQKRLLVIDDEPYVFQGLQRLLHTLYPEWRVVGVENGNKALQLQAENPFDVIISDILMPDKEGLETILELRRRFPAVKIIAISGGYPRMTIDVLYLAKQFGAHRTLAKPFSPDDLVRAVQELL